MYGAWSWGFKTKGKTKEDLDRGLREDCQACKLNKEDAMDRCKWRKMIKDAWWSGWVWVGECFFWYRPTRVVPDQRPLNGRCCCCCCLIFALTWRCLVDNFVCSRITIVGDKGKVQKMVQMAWTFINDRSGLQVFFIDLFDSSLRPSFCSFSSF